MWDEAFQLWDKRNKEIFESDDSSSTQLFDLKQQVTDLYDLEEKVLAQDRINFALTLTERLKLHPFHLHNFVKIQGPIIRQSVKDAEEASGRQHASVDRLLHSRLINPNQIARWPT